MSQGFFEEQADQSFIKASIVSDYFWSWAGVMTATQKRNPQRAQKIAYIDLFAGPGRYLDGAASTPVMILQKAVENDDACKRLVALFNDKDGKNAESLSHEIAAIPGIDRLQYKPQIRSGEVGDEIVKQFQSASLVPTFLFVDPFGYKGLSLNLVNSVLKDWGCDCVFFFNYNRISMGLGNESVAQHMDALFGRHRANHLRERFNSTSARPVEREALIVEEMMAALREMGGKFVLPFRFRNPEGTRTTHHLFFVSKHFKGYELMREVMYKHSRKDQSLARLEYNPAEANAPSLFEYLRPLGELEDMLLEDFAGSTTTIRPLFERHSLGKPFVIKNYKSVLCRMEEEGKVKMEPAHPLRKKGTLGENVRITFPRRRE